MEVTLIGSRILLRPLALQDADSYHRNFVDYEVIRYLSRAVPWPYPADGVTTWLKTQVLPKQGENRRDFAICLKNKPEEVIGSISLWRPGTPENRGFWLGRSFWGQGLMSEACELLERYAFLEMGFKELILSNALGNHRSKRLKEKAGAQFLHSGEREFVDRDLNQHEVWCLSKQAWQNRCGHDGIRRTYGQSDSVTSHIWYIDGIWKRADSLETEEVSLDRIVGPDQVTWFSESNPATVRSVAQHARRIYDADLSYPPILTEDWRVFDGMHRIAKAILQEKPTIRVKRFLQNPEPDMILHIPN